MKDTRENLELLASIMDKDIMVDLLEDRINKYKNERTEDNYRDVIVGCGFILQKASIESDGGLEKYRERIADAERRIKFFDTENN